MNTKDSEEAVRADLRTQLARAITRPKPRTGPVTLSDQLDAVEAIFVRFATPDHAAVVEALERALRAIHELDGRKMVAPSLVRAAVEAINEARTALSMSKAPQTPSHITAQQLAEIICPRSFAGPKNFGTQNEFAKELGRANALAKAETILALVHEAPQAGTSSDGEACGNSSQASLHVNRDGQPSPSGAPQAGGATSSDGDTVNLPAVASERSESELSGDRKSRPSEPSREKFSKTDMLAFADILDSDWSNRSIEMTDKRRDMCAVSLRIAASIPSETTPSSRAEPVDHLPWRVCENTPSLIEDANANIVAQTFEVYDGAATDRERFANMRVRANLIVAAVNAPPPSRAEVVEAPLIDRIIVAETWQSEPPGTHAAGRCQKSISRKHS